MPSSIDSDQESIQLSSQKQDYDVCVNDGDLEDVKLDELSVKSITFDASTPPINSPDLKEKEVVYSLVTSANILQSIQQDNLENCNGEGNAYSTEDDLNSAKRMDDGERTGALSSVHNTTIIHSSEETPKEAFKRLSNGLQKNELTHKDILDSIFNLLVGGAFDLESRFVIENSENIVRMMKMLDAAPVDFQAEVWSVFVAVVRKSNRNLEACSSVGLIGLILDRLSDCDSMVSDLLVQLSGVLTSYSISVKETKKFLCALKAKNGCWKKNSVKLLNILKEMPKRDGADVFFSFPGLHNAGIALPPLIKWPYQNGWTVSTWLRMDPLNSVNFEKEKPYVYSFRSTKGLLGYSCYFMGNCLVVSSTKVQSKETARCIRFELNSRKWHHIVIAYVYSRWTRSEINCYVDGQLIEVFDLSWHVSTVDHFDRCTLGCGPDGEEPFCGQMGAFYVFGEAITQQQANAIYHIGPSYQSTFRFDVECDLPQTFKKHLFDARLHSSIVISYSPKNCDDRLCLHSSPRTGSPYFVQFPHAIMREGVKVIKTHSVHSSLHSIGGMQMILPLFAQLDLPYPENSTIMKSEICSTLLTSVLFLLNSSRNALQQLFHSKAFLIISDLLTEASKEHLTLQVLSAFIDIAKFLSTTPAGLPLFKQLLDHIFFSPQLWVKADAEVQIRLYHYLSEEFMVNSDLLLMMRRCSVIIELLHAIKFYYWIVQPRSPSTYSVKSSSKHLEMSKIFTIRQDILVIIARLIHLGISKDNENYSRDAEFNALLNFIATVHEDDNLYDVLALTAQLLTDQPAAMVPAFDRKRGIAVVFKLITSANELIRIPALKILGIFLCRSTAKRKEDSIGNQNVLTLLTDRLLLHATHLTIATYNVLFEILIENMTTAINYNLHSPVSSSARFENQIMLKVIGDLIAQSGVTSELMKVKKAFLSDILSMCESVRENRRTILQMSVWQDWLMSLAYVFPSNAVETAVTDLVYRIFSRLLFHAIRLEYGGWRVWVDTLAIAHSKVSWERYRVSATRQTSTCTEEVVRKAVSDMVSAVVYATDGKLDEVEKKCFTADDRPSAIYRTPEFQWSSFHLRLLNDLLSSIESVIYEWKSECSSVIDAVNTSDNNIFVMNCVHLISQFSDSLIMACGGLLPLLAAATSPSSELEMTDSTSQALGIVDAAHLLVSFIRLADVFIFASGISLSDLEREKNMPSGGILRQALRLVSTMAVRNILACRSDTLSNIAKNMKDEKILNRIKLIRSFISSALENMDGELDTERLLQEIDIQRLKGVIYRDIEENRQAQFLALAITYLLSVLMVSRYRDILEPPSMQSPFFDTTAAGRPRLNSNEITESERKICSIDSKGGERKKVSGGDDRTDLIPSAVHSAQRKTSKNCESYLEDHLKSINSESFTSRFHAPGERQMYLTNKLQTALETTGPLLREIMVDFRPFLQKTLLGTHSQEIMNDAKVMETMKNPAGSVVELVMLLCSQEWQTSLQKHAGLAFIELVNEGRIMAHATRDHVLRVANEADFILNRLRADDVSKHAQFESASAEQMHRRRQEEAVNDHFITASKRRESLVAKRLCAKITEVLTRSGGAWEDCTNKSDIFWKLDNWEDDSRRRKRFVMNPHGWKHPASDLTSILEGKSSPEDMEKAREELLRDLVTRRVVSLGCFKAGSALSELVDESDIDKWASEPDNAADMQRDSTTYSTNGNLIYSGIIIPGTVSIASTELYFDADEGHPLYKKQDPLSLRYCENQHGRWHFHEIRAIFLRRFLLENTALELFLSSRTAIMFAFDDEDRVREVVKYLPRVGVGVKYGLPQSRKTSLMTPRQLFKHSDMPQKWQRREISNFDYLMFLNTIAGRTYNDLNQYPIFPWIIANYTSDVLDLNLASNFRDLSKPVGALSESRRKYFQERYASWEHETIPPFHYGTHYSTQAFTLNWLLRIEPFTTMFLHLQCGKFDQSDRLFHSIALTWENCQRDTHDVKELIPELFYLPEMLRNTNGFDLGQREDGSLVGDVILPPWASSPEHFIAVHRKALESDLVSCQLNQWIDLIFGYKQKGPEAIRATNVFYYLTYEGAINLNSIENPSLREGLEQQMLSFGQTPAQLMNEPHPPRHSVMTISPTMFQGYHDDLCMLMKFISNSSIVHLSANTYTQISNPSIVSITNNLIFAVNKWNANYNGQLASQLSPTLNAPIETGLTDFSSNALVNLPLTVDPLLASGNPAQPLVKRHLGDALDQRLKVRWNNFVTTVDSRSIIVCGYPDYSIRVIDTDSGKIRQVIYGHGDVATCLARSEANLFADCYLASGGLDCIVILWHWNAQTQAIVGEYNIPGEAASPRAILTGHDTHVCMVFVSAEHGLVISASDDSTILMHTTLGDLLRSIKRIDSINSVLNSVNLLLMSRDCVILVLYGCNDLVIYTTSSNRLAHMRVPEKILCGILSRDGEYLVTGSESGRVSVFRLFPLKLLHTFQEADSAIRSLAITSNQRFIIVGLDSGAIIVFNIDFNKWHYEYRNRYTLH